MIGRCLVCHVDLADSDELAAHLKCRFTFACPECDKSFLHPKDVGTHRLTVHGVRGSGANARALARAKAGKRR